jgi:hypothetical protein
VAPVELDDALDLQVAVQKHHRDEGGVPAL